MQEATKLCKLLNRNIVFSKETQNLDTHVRATDLARDLTILWSVEAFDGRVECLKTY